MSKKNRKREVNTAMAEIILGRMTRLSKEASTQSTALYGALGKVKHKLELFIGDVADATDAAKLPRSISKSKSFREIRQLHKQIAAFLAVDNGGEENSSMMRFSKKMAKAADKMTARLAKAENKVPAASAHPNSD